MIILQIYYTLLNNYGPQNWWPVTSKDKPEYLGGPKTEKQQLEVIIGAILTQNTSWKNVEKAIIELHKKDLIDVDRIIEIPLNDLAKIIKSSGYFNQKAKKLKTIALFLKKNPLSKLQKFEIMKLRKLLLDINGVGPETADSIILYAFNKPIFVVDAYTKRIFYRIGLIKDAKYNEIQQLFHSSLKKDAQLFNEYHALIVEHAKRYCRKKPLCSKCVLNKTCKKGERERASSRLNIKTKTKSFFL